MGAERCQRGCPALPRTAQPCTHLSMRTSSTTRTSSSRQEAMGISTVWIQNHCSCSSATPATSRGGHCEDTAGTSWGPWALGTAATLAGGVVAPEDRHTPLAPQLGVATIVVDLAAHVEGVVFLIVHAGEGEDDSFHLLILQREEGWAVRASAAWPGGRRGGGTVTVQLVSLLLLYLTTCSRHCSLG